MSAILTVTFQGTNIPPNNTYRIAYKYNYTGFAPAAPIQNPSWPNYDIDPTTVTVTASGGLGTGTFTLTFPFMINNTCEGLVVDGYIQPTCEAEASPLGRAPFNTAVQPTEPCKAYIVTCINPAGCSASVNMGTNTCIGNPYGTLLPTAYNEQFSICYSGGVLPPFVPGSLVGAGYNGTPYPEDFTVCCYQCEEIDIAYDGSGNSRVQYVDCATNALASVAFSGAIPSTVTRCVKQNSYKSDNPSAITYTVNGLCP